MLVDLMRFVARVMCFLLGAFSSYNLNIVIDPVSFTRWCTAIWLYCVVEDVTIVYKMLDKY